MRILIIGCGYVGLSLGARLVSAGHDVFGIRRDPAGFHELRSLGIRPIAADITIPPALDRITERFDAVVNVVSSTKGGLEEYRLVYLEGTRNVLRWLAERPPAKYFYTSSTSVYGQLDGTWVSEECETAPASATSRILVETEQELLRLAAPLPFSTFILRAGGIYGPGRGHLFKQFLRGEATLRGDGQNWINSIHLDDVSGAIAHLLARPCTGGVYNIVDSEPVTQLEFFKWLSSVTGQPLPPSASPDPSRKRGLTNKRVSNAKLLGTGYVLKYPTFRDGYVTEVRATLSANSTQHD